MPVVEQPGLDSPKTKDSRIAPVFQQSSPLMIGSGDRCKRVVGSCYVQDDPKILEWMRTQEQDEPPVDYASLVLLGCLLSAASILWWGVSPIERHLRDSGLLTWSPRRTRFLITIVIVGYALSSAWATKPTAAVCVIAAICLIMCVV